MCFIKIIIVDVFGSFIDTVQSDKYRLKLTNWCLEKSFCDSSSKWEYNALFFKSCLFQGEVMHGTDTNKTRVNFLLMS